MRLARARCSRVPGVSRARTRSPSAGSCATTAASVPCTKPARIRGPSIARSSPGVSERREPALTRVTSHPSLLERVAALELAALEAAPEPLHALLRAAVRERLGHHGPLRLPLDAVVADRSRRCEPLLHVALLEHLTRAVGVMRAR